MEAARCFRRGAVLGLDQGLLSAFFFCATSWLRRVFCGHPLRVEDPFGTGGLWSWPPHPHRWCRLINRGGAEVFPGITLFASSACFPF